MAMSVRASVAKSAVKAQAPKRQPVKVQALSQKAVAAAGVATIAAASIVAPAEAANVLSTVASAATGYPFVPPEWAPSVLVPFTGLIFPLIVCGWAFNWIEKDAPKA